MKSRFSSTLIIYTIFMCLSCTNTKKQEQLSEEEQAKKMLKEFYSGYITIGSKIPGATQKEYDSITNKYCTPNFLSQFDESLDYDPFIKSQMFETELIKSITVKKDSLDNKVYLVSYYWPHADPHWITIKLHVVNENGEYKIDLVYKDL